MSKYRFDCGCEFEILGEGPTAGALPRLVFDAYDIRPDCKATWNLLSQGHSKGVFQLESNLGKQWVKRLKPREMEHMAALGAILRPGALKAEMEPGLSMTKLYCLRVNGEAEVKSFHPLLDPILAPTLQVLVYQEQSMKLGQVIAGFDLKEVDRLRKAIGKKDEKELSAVGELFLAKAKEKGVVPYEVAETVWGWIKKSGRYQFNKCISGDTIVRRANRRNKYGEWNMTVEEMYRVRHDPEYAKATGHDDLRRKWKRLGHYGNSVSLCSDGRIRPNLICDIQPAGYNPVYRITLANGAFIRVTANHKFPTAQGELRTDELSVGMSLFTCGEYEPSDFRAINRGQKGYPSIEIPIVSIVLEEVVETYDVTMAAPYHNFVVNTGIVTCNSHSLSYGVIGYITAYIKTHFPVHFFCMWLRYGQEKSSPLEEINELVNEAKLFDVPILPPEFRRMKKHFSTDFKQVFFGLSDIKGVGDSLIAKIKDGVKTTTETLGKTVADWTWNDILCTFSNHVPASAMEKLISVGAFDYLGKGQRLRRLEEMKLWASLTDKEKRWIFEYAKRDELLVALKRLSRPRAKGTPEPGGCATEKRRQAVLSKIQLLENPPTPLDDYPGWIARTEAELLGVALTCSEVDALDPRDVNTTCKEYLNGSNGDNYGGVILGVKIESVRTWKCKQGKNAGREMAYLSVSDASCSLGDVVVFPDNWAVLKGVLFEDNCVILRGERGRKNDGLIVKSACQM